MTAPLIHIFSADLQEGQLEGYEKYAKDHVAFVEENHSELLSFNVYLSEDGRRVSVVQVHPDPGSLDTFMKEIVPAHGVQAYQYLERGSERSDAYGSPSDAAQTQIREFGVDLRLSPRHLGGFTRLTTEIGAG